ncbi:MAG: alcohol dehydrogenase catalytic domain-containing protein [Thermodesulfobacteria bacterium]|nr:alcohol dehydrogenase catalytic domain-containing protein [Thermodesulfobacteriota bacterium]
MKAWVIFGVFEVREGENFLKLEEVEEPQIRDDEVLLKVEVCGVCHTEIDEIEGRAKPSFYPVIPGHQIVGKVVEVGRSVTKFKPGDRAGAGWIFSACGKCKFCKSGLENLCPEFKATGKDAHGGYAEYFKISENYAFKLPESVSAEVLAPLFCAGAIGYRSLKLSKVKDGDVLGLLGFGASGHIVFKIVRHLFPNTKIFVFSHSERGKKLAKEFGADWVGSIDEEPPEPIDAIIDTTPVWGPPFMCLRYLGPAGRLVINAIRKEDADKAKLLEISYERDLWMEKEIKTVANVTAKDIEEFLGIAIKANISPDVEVYDFKDTMRALIDLKLRRGKTAKVIVI